MQSLRSHALWLSGLLTLCGCSGGSENLPKVFPVTGVVTFNGDPVEGAYVIFTPNESGARTAGGKTDAEGVYHLSTFADKDGCSVGRMTVTVSKSETPTEPDPKTGKIPPRKNYLPNRYSEAANSGLEATVAAEGENHFDFTLEK